MKIKEKSTLWYLKEGFIQASGLAEEDRYRRLNMHEYDKLSCFTQSVLCTGLAVALGAELAAVIAFTAMEPKLKEIFNKANELLNPKITHSEDEILFFENQSLSSDDFYIPGND